MTLIKRTITVQLCNIENIGYVVRSKQDVITPFGKFNIRNWGYYISTEPLIYTDSYKDHDVLKLVDLKEAKNTYAYILKRIRFHFEDHKVEVLEGTTLVGQ